MTPDGTAPLPAAWYLDADAFMRERQGLFAMAWQMIARKDALAVAGDYVCHSLAGLAVFAMRSEAGAVAAFANICRHQGLPVLDAGNGRSPLLRCRYHGWTYRFDGRFKEAPVKFEPANPADAVNNLRPLPLAEWRGLLFVSPDGDPADLEAELRPLEPALDAALPAPASLAAELVTDMQCNWKLFAEHWLALEGERRLWHFPTLALEVSPGVLAVHQVIPRTHERTRVVTHVLASDAARGAPAVEAAKEALAASKAACEVPQALAAAAPGSALARFRARIAAAHAAQDRG